MGDKLPAPLWEPTTESIAGTNIGRAMSELGFASYDQLYAWSVTEPGDFWGFAVEKLAIRFSAPPAETLDLAAGVEQPTWLRDAQLNIADSCFRASDDAVAIVEKSASGLDRATTYGQLNMLSARVAASLPQLGMKLGDSIGVFLPMTTEAVAIYLGIVRAGCTVVSIADSFSAEQLASRLQIGNARLVFTVRSIERGPKSIPVYQRVVDAIGPGAVVIEHEPSGNHLRAGDIDWAAFLSLANVDHLGHQLEVGQPAAPDAAINILFSSGTTGDPKAIVWDHTTAIKAAADGYFHQDIQPGDVTAWPTNLGWMMGPWLIFASLINRATIAIYGGSPTESGFGDFVEQAAVNMLGVVPSMVKAWRETDCFKCADWRCIELFSSTGECSNPADMKWLSEKAGGKPVVEYCGGTEIGGGYITSTLVQPNLPSAFSSPALGSRLMLLDDDGNEADQGEIYLVPPALGLSRRLLNRDHHQEYFANTPITPSAATLRRHGDQMVRLANGYYQALGRADDTMNLGGIKVGAAEIERVLSALPGVLELAAIAVPTPGGGPSQLVLYAAPHENAELEVRTIKESMQQAICQRLNPLFRIHAVVLVERLPRTASQKIMRRQLREDWAKRTDDQIL